MRGSDTKHSGLTELDSSAESQHLTLPKGDANIAVVEPLREPSSEKRTMRMLIKDTTAITLDDEDRILRDTTIALEDARILAVGEAPPDFKPDQVIDGREQVALPGFFNAHCHAAMTLERGWAEDLPFDRWLNEKIWVAESALEEEDVYWGAALACCEMIRAGIVAFADHYFWLY